KPPYFNIFSFNALRITITTRNSSDMIHHSDLSKQYACQKYIEIFLDNGIIINMSAKDNPYENAYIKSFLRGSVG
ncbi:hypothetical protein KA005_21695, partial [bacterium]|nr:hypothetical protein [bacterium]